LGGELDSGKREKRKETSPLQCPTRDIEPDEGKTVEKKEILGRERKTRRKGVNRRYNQKALGLSEKIGKG